MRLILILDAVAVVVFLAFVIMDAMKTSVLHLDVTPVDAKVLVNGSEYTNGSYKVMPGSYKIEISHEGMATKTFEVDLAGDAIANITTFLVDEDGGFGFYELRDNYDSYVKLAEIVGAGSNETTDGDVSAEEFVARMKEDLAVYTSGVLPINYSEYEDTDMGRKLVKDITIQGWNEGCSLTLCLRALMLYTDDKDFINTLLVNNGFNAEDYEIIYKIY